MGEWMRFAAPELRQAEVEWQDWGRKRDPFRLKTEKTKN